MRSGAEAIEFLRGREATLQKNIAEFRSAAERELSALQGRLLEVQGMIAELAGGGGEGQQEKAEGENMPPGEATG